jgi:uncharacterized membrane protein
MSEGKQDQGKLATDENPNSGICYVFGILFPLVYLLSVRREKQNEFLRFNSFQCLLILAPLLFFGFVDFPTGWPEKLGGIGFLVCIVALFTAMIQAWRRKWLYLPAIGTMAKWLAER